MEVIVSEDVMNEQGVISGPFHFIPFHFVFGAVNYRISQNIVNAHFPAQLNSKGGFLWISRIISL